MNSVSTTTMKMVPALNAVETTIGTTAELVKKRHGGGFPANGE